MGKAKKRQYKLYSAYRKQYGDSDLTKLYYMAKDKDQREQAALQAERWRKEREKR